MTTSPGIADFISRRAAPIPRFYGEALLDRARRDPRILCLCADLRASTETDIFREALPERFFDVGIAEANMLGIAGGLARCGFIPFVHTFSAFATRRCFDQVAMQTAYPRLPVKIAGFLPGLTTFLGVSHQAIDDVAMMRTLPNMTVIEPCGPEQMAAAVDAALAVDGPVYLRMKRPEGEVQPFTPRPLPLGRAERLREGRDVLVVAAGIMVPKALEAATLLAAEGIEARVLNMASLKPIDADAILEGARHCGRVVTAENHLVTGGLGSVVAEILAEAGVPTRLRRVGLRDTFAEGASPAWLQEKYGLTAEAIVAAARELAG
ncbi:MAG TPA: transketolase C-terminal domain-containing protein [Roseomonas sp.]|nr:transketolase C-terminal domain-containing protein [Roseomonas sp.]